MTDTESASKEARPPSARLRLALAAAVDRATSAFGGPREAAPSDAAAEARASAASLASARRLIATPWLLALGFGVLVLIGVTTVLLVARAREAANAANHSLEVENAISTLQLMLRRAESGQRGYLLTDDPAALKTFKAAIDQVVPAAEQIRTLVADNGTQARAVDTIDDLLKEKVAELTETVRLHQAGDIAGALAVVRGGHGEALNQALGPTIMAMKAEEQRLTTERTANLRQAMMLLLVVNFAALVLIIILSVAAIIQTRRTRRALEAASDQLRDANENLEAIVDVRTADLREANEEIQRFAYIVSHDLRAPLVNIMGFTTELVALRDEIFELLRAQRLARGNGTGEEPEPEPSLRETELAHDVDEALDFIRASIGKMDRLINAILKISREGRRAFRAESIDMSALIGSIVASLEHQIQEANATITVGRLPRQVSDRLAVEQIFTNLIDNAVKYLRPGIAGEIRIACSETTLANVYTVEDNGRGVADKDRERIFELFRRAGVQDRQGEGIGLAHVRTLVRRLGGTITIESTAGAGSTFTVTLPRRWTDDKNKEQR